MVNPLKREGQKEYLRCALFRSHHQTFGKRKFGNGLSKSTKKMAICLESEWAEIHFSTLPVKFLHFLAKLAR